MDRDNKIGLVFAIVWMLFVVVLFASYLYIKDYPVDYFIDEETSGFISLGFFCLWAAIWFFIGRHLSKDFAAKKFVYKQQYPLLTEEVINKAFKEWYFSKLARTLSIVMFCAVPFYIAANVQGDLTTKNYIYIGSLMILSTVLYWYSKRHSSQSK